jgi:hypothetical protein
MVGLAAHKLIGKAAEAADGAVFRRGGNSPRNAMPQTKVVLGAHGGGPRLAKKMGDFPRNFQFLGDWENR